ncbi:MraY family glycosyltransferase [Streptomyces sp. S6]
MAAATCGLAVVGDRTGLAPLDPGTGTLLVASAAVALLGLAADLWRLKTRFLVIGTTVSAAFVIPFGDIGALGGVVSVAWVVFVALAFRSLDHADGVAGTAGVVTAFGAGACAAAEVMDGPAVLLSVLAAALTGFLMHNWPHARVGLGTCGALFTGFLPAAVAVQACAGREPLTGAGVLLALTAVAALDVVLVALSRARAGRPLLRPAPDHLAHRLRRLGITAQGSVVLIGAGVFAGVLVGVLAHAGWTGGAATVWVGAGAGGAVVGLLRVRVYGPQSVKVRAACRGERLGNRAPGSRRLTLVRRLVGLGRLGRQGVQAADVTPGAHVQRPRRPESSQVRGGMRVRNG